MVMRHYARMFGYKPILISTIVDTPAGKRIFKIGYKPILISTIVDINESKTAGSGL